MAQKQKTLTYGALSTRKINKIAADYKEYGPTEAATRNEVSLNVVKDLVKKMRKNGIAISYRKSARVAWSPEELSILRKHLLDDPEDVPNLMELLPNRSKRAIYSVWYKLRREAGLKGRIKRVTKKEIRNGVQK